MAGPGERPSRRSHESRLLLITIAICVVVLLLLSRLRFPEAPPIVDASVPPLERLAARVSSDALTADVERLEALIGPSLVVLTTRAPAAPAPRRLDDVIGESPAWDQARQSVALRLDATTAVGVVSADARLEVAGNTLGPAGPATSIGTDAIRRVSLVRVPEAPARPVPTVPLSGLRRPLWVVAVEGTQAGFTLRPIQLGRGERFASARWSNPLLPLGGTTVAPGALIFSVAGDFLGIVVIDAGALAIADARDVLELAARIGSGGSPGPASLGVAVQPLTPELAVATGAPRGVVVAEVEAGGPAAGVLRPGDVITTLAETGVDDPDRFLLTVASLPPQAVTVRIVRAGVFQALEVTPVAQVPPAEPQRGAVRFERTPGTGTRVVEDTTDRGLATTALRPGDLVVAAGVEPDPTPVQIRRLLDAASPDAGVVFTVRREGQQFVVVVHPPAPTDVP